MAEFIRFDEYNRRGAVWSGVQMRPGHFGAEAFHWSKENLDGLFTHYPNFNGLRRPRKLQHTYLFSDPAAAIHFRLKFEGTPV